MSFVWNARRVDAVQVPGSPAYANCPECHAQNVVKFGKATECFNCGTRMTPRKVDLAPARFTRPGAAQLGVPSNHYER